MDTFSPSSAKLTLYIKDVKALRGSVERMHSFTTDGGSFGSEPSGIGNHWQLQDSAMKVRALNAYIAWNDGQFCLQDLIGNCLINNSVHGCPPEKLIALSQGDTITIGDLILTAHLQLTAHSQSAPDYLQLQNIISTEATNNVNRVIDEPTSVSASQHHSYLPSQESAMHPYEPSTLGLSRNSVADNSATSLLDNPFPHRVEPPLTSQEEHMMDDEYLDVPAPYVPSVSELESNADIFENVALTPVLRGLGEFLPFRNSQVANGFLEEAGRTLQAVVKGLLALNQTQQVANKQLQPIEDNPLRLGLNFQETVAVLYGEQKSQVHLTPSSAVTESLTHMRLHYQASSQATEAALSAVIQSFSPDVLITRFQRYRRDHMVNPNDPNWIWNMYQHYFNELLSGRQIGVEKLFHEVYEQVYDKTLRQLQEEEAR
ncbi:type VI secretion system-associated FHA domain protein TagH [Hafnia alvei]|nr:type VI secretion system-associated FHA domain protein TagH [Hafnia alvei]QQE43950.1 type VI secretion system-associated FHA domain protein TagH [Hafnia alvei]